MSTRFARACLNVTDPPDVDVDVESDVVMTGAGAGYELRNPRESTIGLAQGIPHIYSDTVPWQYMGIALVSRVPPAAIVPSFCWTKALIRESYGIKLFGFVMASSSQECPPMDWSDIVVNLWTR